MDQTKELITKKDAVTRLLDTAIEMFFEDKDNFAINLLVKSAYQIISDMMKRKHGKNYHGYARIGLLVKEEYQNTVFKMFREDVNFAKHSDREGDSNRELEFLVHGCEMFLGLAIPEYCDLFGEATNLQKKFLSFLCYSTPEIMLEPYKSMYTIIACDNPKILDKKTWVSIPADFFKCLKSPTYY